MIIGPKYKIARRLGAPIFEKTQTQKYAIRMERKGRSSAFQRPKSEYAVQQNEKQKARFVYGLSERQFSNYVKEALLKKNPNKPQMIFEHLESRLDNIIYRVGLSGTRIGARQTVSHGHIKVNGKRMDIPSMRLKVGDKIEIRDGSKDKGIFIGAEERMKTLTTPSWIKFDPVKKVGEIVKTPQYVQTDNMFDLNAVVEFYSR